MIPLVASVLCAALILYLVRGLDRQGTSKALWIPVIYLLIAGSRPVSAWLGMAPSNASWSDYAEGSPLDRMVFLMLIVAGSVVLARRKLAWGRLLADNKWIVVYFVFCLISAAWSDVPFVLAKRWIKDLGNPIMALVILTDPRAYDAIGVALRRVAVLLIPISVLFVRWIPALGRQFHVDGTMMHVGVGSQKNDLGLLCLVVGIFLFWELLRRRQGRGDTSLSRLKIALVAAMTGWLLYMSDSQTSVVCLFVGIVVMYLFSRKGVARHPYGFLTIGAVMVLSAWALEETLQIRAMVFEALGRNPTLTNRTEIWEAVLSLAVNPWVGAGFMTFWTGSRLDELWGLIGAPINQAHNGYIEQYLNLGYIGVAFILIIVLNAFRSIARHFQTDRIAAALRLCLLVVALLYNYTEASFYGTNLMWVLLLVTCIDVSGLRVVAQPARPRGAPATARLAR
jgi:exopolysaccharide production protein ExoQ